MLREIGGRFALAAAIFLVGGSVRDAVLGRLTSDLDFTTDARPEEIQHIVRPWRTPCGDTGIDFGTVGVGKAGHRLEITTFRADSYDPGIAKSSGALRRPAAEDDLVRDFTANAMAVRSPPTGRGSSRPA